MRFVKVAIILALLVMVVPTLAISYSDDSAADTYTYYLHYDANGGTGEPYTSMMTNSGNSATFIISNTVPTRSGYLFAGWDVQQRTPDSIPSGDYFPGDEFRVARTGNTTNRTLYAVWVTGYTYRVFYSAGSDATNEPTTQTYGPTPDESHTFTVSSTIPHKTGYTFDYWYLWNGGEYQGGDTITCTNNDPEKILIAYWHRSEYTVTFNANGGSVSPTSKTVTYGDTYGELPTPTRASYDFEGWFTASTGGTEITSSSVYEIEGNQTLYAHWRGRFTYNLYYDTNGGENGPAMDTGTSWRNSYTFTISNTTPTRSGYLFAGWDVQQRTPDSIPSGSYFPGDEFRISASSNTTNRTLYAVWVTGYTYRVFYSVPTDATNYPTTQTYGPTADQSHTFTVSSMIPLRQDYTFDYWYLYNGGDYQGGDTITCTNNDPDRILISYWSPILYTVTFNANGGTVSPESMEIAYGDEYGILPTPTLSGYIFRGWYDALEGGNLVVAGDTYGIREDQTLYAHWSEIATYWSNGNPNGKVSTLYKIDNTNVTNDVVTKYPLYRYDPTIPDITSTDVNESFVATGYYILVEVLSTKVGNSYDAQVIARLYNSSDTMMAENMYDFGSWSAFIVTVDSLNAKIDFVKVMQFRSFTDYEESIKGTILSYSEHGDFSNQCTQTIRIVPVSDTVPRQQVVKTSVFLNTYGIVYIDPELDISTYFPEMNELRLNFFSFALYGNSITINGHTLDVNAPNVTIYYIQRANGNFIANPSDTGVSNKTLELTNIYITWDGTNCILTFANENFSVNLGNYSDKEVSFGGMWYFSTSVYEPYTTTETTYEVDWWDSFSLFDFSAFGIVFAGLVIVMGLASRVIFGGHPIDFIIMGFGAIIGLIFAGGLIIA